MLNASEDLVEVKDHKTNLVNVSSKSCQSGNSVETTNDAELVPKCKVVIKEDNEGDTNQFAVVNIPEIKIDTSSEDDDNDDNDDIEENEDENEVENDEAEWEWEDGEELEYEFYEHEVSKL